MKTNRKPKMGNGFSISFASACNWNIGSNEIGQRRKWDIFLNGRQLEISLYGVRGTRQEYFHIEPDNYIFELAGKIWNFTFVIICTMPI